MSEDDFEKFIGTDFYAVKITDTRLKTMDVQLEKEGVNYLVEEEEDPYMRYFQGEIMFVNIETSKGTLQFALYNAHNGYYGHTAIVHSRECKVEVHL